MTTRIDPLPAAVPTVTVNSRFITIRKTTGTPAVVSLYVDAIDAERIASELRGMLAEAFTAGRQDGNKVAAQLADAITDDRSGVRQYLADAAEHAHYMTTAEPYRDDADPASVARMRTTFAGRADAYRDAIRVLDIAHELAAWYIARGLEVQR